MLHLLRAVPRATDSGVITKTNPSDCSIASRMASGKTFSRPGSPACPATRSCRATGGRRPADERTRRRGASKTRTHQTLFRTPLPASLWTEFVPRQHNSARSPMTIPPRDPDVPRSLDDWIAHWPPSSSRPTPTRSPPSHGRGTQSAPDAISSRIYLATAARPPRCGRSRCGRAAAEARQELTLPACRLTSTGWSRSPGRSGARRTGVAAHSTAWTRPLRRPQPPRVVGTCVGARSPSRQACGPRSRR